MAAAVLDASLADNLTEQELDMTVGEYVQAQLDRRVDELRRHMQDNVASFEAEARKARQALREIAMQSVAASSHEDADDDAAAGGGAPAANGVSCADLGAHIAQAAAAEGVEAFALVGIKGAHVGKVLKIQPVAGIAKWTIGRAENKNDHSLAGDDEVSSEHAKIVYETKTKQFKLMDVGSTNGTFASSLVATAVKLKARKYHTLKLDHLVTFGSTTFKWCYYADALNLANELAKDASGKKTAK